MNVIPDRDANGHIISYASAFALKEIDGLKLFKRVHGLSSTSIPANTTGYIIFTIPYATCKFSGAELIGCSEGDSLNYLILDDATNTYSQAPVDPYGPNFLLNQFGFDVKMPDGRYDNTSNYDADLFVGMQLMCVYKNNTAEAQVIHMNVELHELKA